MLRKTKLSQTPSIYLLFLAASSAHAKNYDITLNVLDIFTHKILITTL